MAQRVSQKIKAKWRRMGEKDESLKQFARRIRRAEGVAADWLDHKAGKPEKEAKALRLRTKGSQLRLIAEATHMARRKGKQPANAPKKSKKEK